MAPQRIRRHDEDAVCPEGNVRRAEAVPIAPRLSTLVPSHSPQRPISVVPPAFKTYSQRPLISELDDLRRSHAQMSTLLAKLSDDLDATRKVAASDRECVSKCNAALRKKLVQRTLIFAKIAAVKALKLGSSELAKNCRALVPANSVRQAYIKSRAVDCTLQDFQFIAQTFLKSPDVQCTIFPSSYYATFPCARSISRLEISFRSYSELCHALQIDVAKREEALYKERYSKRCEGRKLLASQVLGVEVVETASEGLKNRSVLLGYGIPQPEVIVSNSFYIPTLFQSACVWTEDSWNSGFIFKKKAAEGLRGIAPPPDLSDEPKSPKTSDINGRSPDPRNFSLVWERMNCKSLQMIPTPDNVPGSLRSVFPAVVLRTTILTSSAQAVFTTRVDGKFPLQIVVSPCPQNRQS